MTEPLIFTKDDWMEAGRKYLGLSYTQTLELWDQAQVLNALHEEANKPQTEEP